MQTARDALIHPIEAQLLLGAKVNIDPNATHIGGSWQGKEPGTGIPRPWDPDTLKFFYEQTGKFKNAFILDIGANTGTYCLLPVLNRSIRGYAFEPNPEVYRILKNNLTFNALQNNIQTVPVALSDRKGVATLKIPVSGTDSGLACLGTPQRFNGWREISVPMDTLDNVAKLRNISHVDLIKIDTEGCELSILLGGEKLIRCTLPDILLEFEERNTAQFGYHPKEIAKLLMSWGYSFRKISSSDAFFYKKKRVLCEKTLNINAEKRKLAEMNLHKTVPDMAQDRTVCNPAQSKPAPPPYSHWIEVLATIDDRLYYRDQSASSLQSLANLAQDHAPTVIVELGTLSGMSTRAWVSAVPDARIHTVDLSFKAFWKANEYFPVDTSRISFHEKNILSMDFKSLWSPSDRILFFIDAHDLPDVPIMRHVLEKALPHLPKDSIVIVDDIWFSPERLGPDNAKDYFNQFLLGQIDELQCFTGHYAPYHKSGTLIGFQEVFPLMDFVNSRSIVLGLEPHGKHVWFTWDGERHKNVEPAKLEHDEQETGFIEYNPLVVKPVEPLASKILPTVAQLYQKGRIHEANKLLIDLINKEPSQSAYFALAVCQARIGKLDEAYKLTKLTLQLRDDTWRIDRLASDLERKVGRPKAQMTGKKGLTIFAVPKAFSGHEAIIQKNAIRSWAKMTPEPEIILMGDDPGVREMALEVGAKHVPNIATNEYGTPLVDDIFSKAWDAAANDILAYVNADIILMDDFQLAVAKVVKKFQEFLVIGQRWDLPVWKEIDFSSHGWVELVRKEVQENGFLHAESGLDYFIHPRRLWRGMPPFALGRTVWDNWLVKRPHEDGAHIIDGTGFITAVHQDHEYNHCLGGREGAWLGVEANRNRAMAGSIGNNCFTTAARWVFSQDDSLLPKSPSEPLWLTDEVKHNQKKWLLAQSKRMKTRGQIDMAKAYLEIASKI